MVAFEFELVFRFMNHFFMCFFLLISFGKMFDRLSRPFLGLLDVSFCCISRSKFRFSFGLIVNVARKGRNGYLGNKFVLWFSLLIELKTTPSDNQKAVAVERNEEHSIF